MNRILILGLGVAALCSGAPNFQLTIHSEPGDFVGNGKDYSYTQADGQFHLSSFSSFVNGMADSAQLTFFQSKAPFDFWVLQFSTHNATALVRGTYGNALRIGATGLDPSRPAMDVSGIGRGCSQVFGQFTVLAATLVPNSVLDVPGTSFAATFQQHCDSPSAPLLTGTISFYDTANAPTADSVTPNAGSGPGQNFTSKFSDPNGWQDLGVLNVLINKALDGRHACFIGYSRPDNMLCLVNDNSDGLLPGLLLNGSGAVSNSQCTVTGAGSTAVGRGNTLTLTLNLSFSPAFTGNKLVYIAARDSAENNSGWQTLGVLGVPPVSSTFPVSVGMTPASGTSNTSVFTYTYQDKSDANNLQTTWALINKALDGAGACYAAYYRPGNLLFLLPDDGDGSRATSMVLNGVSTSLSNSQCTILGLGSSAAISGNQLAVTLNTMFKPAFAGRKAVWLGASTQSGQSSDWQALGVWQVPGSTIVAVEGDAISTGGYSLFSDQSLVASWTTTSAYTGVTISAHLSGQPGTYIGTAYLTDQVGPGTTLANQLFSAPFTAVLTAFPFQADVIVLSGATLGPGKVYLTLASNSGPNSGFAWTVAAFGKKITTAPGITRNIDLTSYGSPQSAYPPASTFTPLPNDTSSPLQFAVTGTPVSSSVP